MSLAAGSLLLCPHSVAAASSGVPIAHAALARGRIALDGILDEPSWQHTTPMRLMQQDPKPGEPTRYDTEVRVLVDRARVYFGITCADPDIAHRSVHTLERDSDQTGDDHLTLVLDTFGNHRTGYVCQVNAGGGRTDGLISPSSRDPSFDWDGIWDAVVRRTSAGWTAEIAIDARSLQFRPGLDHWGINVQRYVTREHLSLQWANITLDANIFDLSRMGVVGGVGEFDHGFGLEVSPYGLIRHDSVGSRTSAQTGGDVRYNVTPELAAIATLNPDFAEAEVDTQQINLTRFSLFFPEKRRFFLEGSNQFTFAAGLDSPDSPVMIPFYSRRIGLVDGQTVRLDEGLKVIGQAGSWSIGALDVETGRSPVSGPTNLFAGKFAYDADEHLRLGALVTHGDPTGQTDNTFAGVDAVWHTSKFLGDKNLTLSGWAARSSGDSLPGRHSGWGLYAQYPNDLWSGYASINVFGEALDPALGFLPRPGTRQYDVYIDYRPRPTTSPWAWARQFFFQIEPQQIDDLHGRTQTRRIFIAPFNVDTESGEHLEFDWIPDYEALTEPFEIAEGVVLPVGRYHFDRYRLEAQSSDARPLRVGSVVEIGHFYGGRLNQTRPFVNWTALEGRLRFELSNETDYGYLPQGNFIQRLYQLKVAYAFSPDLVVSSFTQYDTTVGHAGVNARLHWTVAPGRDFFLVFNHGVETSATDPIARLQPISNAIIAKLRWDFRW